MASSHCLLLSCLALLMAMAAATQHRVGGPVGWTVPTAISFNQWAERNRFQIRDSLLFVYPPDRDSVLRVTQGAYSTCNTSSYLQRFDDGNTVFTFDKSGPYYFISGNKNDCLRNESMRVVVMADRSNRLSNDTPVSPPPAATLPLSPPSPLPSSPAEVPPPPSSEVPPPPSGSAEVPPSPTSEAPPSPSEVPPPPSAELMPSPGPTGEEYGPPPPPNAASLKVAGFMSSVGALFGSLFFVF